MRTVFIFVKQILGFSSLILMCTYCSAHKPTPLLPHSWFATKCQKDPVFIFVIYLLLSYLLLSYLKYTSRLTCFRLVSIGSDGKSDRSHLLGSISFSILAKPISIDFKFWVAVDIYWWALIAIWVGHDGVFRGTRDMVAQGSREIACLGAKVTKTILQYYWTYSCEYFDALNDILEAQSWGRSEEVEQKKRF